MPVLDLEKLDTDSIKGLADTYDEICNEVLSPFPEMENDPIRMKIDDAVAKALGLPDFLVYRMMLVQEPMVCLRRLG